MKFYNEMIEDDLHLLKHRGRGSSQSPPREAIEEIIQKCRLLKEGVDDSVVLDEDTTDLSSLGII